MTNKVDPREEQFMEWVQEKSAASLLALVYGDDAIRMSDIVNTAVKNGFGQDKFWLAIRLSDGGGDEIAYESRADAIKHQLHEQQCCYVRIPMDGMPPRACHAFLRVHRMAYDAGFRMVDPDNPRRMLMVPTK